MYTDLSWLLPCRKTSNRVAVSANVFAFIKRHWTPSNKHADAGDVAGAASAAMQPPFAQQSVDLTPSSRDLVKDESDRHALVASEGAGQAMNVDDDNEIGQEQPAADVRTDDVGVAKDTAAPAADALSVLADGLVLQQGATLASDQVPATATVDYSEVSMIEPVASPAKQARSTGARYGRASSQAGTHGARTLRVLEFPAADAELAQCTECAALMGGVEQAADNFKQRVLNERAECHSLLGNTTLLFLKEGERYALAPRTWLAQWRRWVSSSPWKEQGALAVARAGFGEAGMGDDGALRRGGLEGLTDAMAEFTVHVDGELRLLLNMPPLKSYRDKWCQVRWPRYTCIFTCLMCMASLVMPSVCVVTDAVHRLMVKSVTLRDHCMALETSCNDGRVMSIKTQ